MKTLHILPSELSDLKNPPKQLFYKGNKELLQKEKVAIVGSRRPYSYTKNIVYELSKKLSNAGICVVSGAAMGVDTIAHSSAGVKNTIAVMGNALDIRYPKVNNNLIKDIEKNGLVLSQFEPGFKATPWSFVVRNKIVVALANLVVIAQADLNSGSMRSADFALKQGKEIFVLPHRIGESLGTNKLLNEAKAKVIYDIDDFVAKISKNVKITLIKDEFWEFCSNFPKYQDAVRIYKDKIFEAELNGDIIVENGIIRVC